MANTICELVGVFVQALQLFLRGLGFLVGAQ